MLKLCKRNYSLCIHKINFRSKTNSWRVLSVTAKCLGEEAKLKFEYIYACREIYSGRVRRETCRRRRRRLSCFNLLVPSNEHLQANIKWNWRDLNSVNAWPSMYSPSNTWRCLKTMSEIHLEYLAEWGPSTGRFINRAIQDYPWNFGYLNSFHDVSSCFHVYTSLFLI